LRQLDQYEIIRRQIRFKHAKQADLIDPAKRNRCGAVDIRCRGLDGCEICKAMGDEVDLAFCRVEVCDRIATRRSAQNENIRALLAADNVIPGLAINHIGAGIAEDAVIACTAVDHVIADETDEFVITAFARDRIRLVDFVSAGDAVHLIVAG
jgi:hypothetical protein